VTAATKADVVAVIDQIFAILTVIRLPVRARSKRHCEDCWHKNICLWPLHPINPLILKAFLNI